jgi:hypothetical protein
MPRNVFSGWAHSRRTVLAWAAVVLGLPLAALPIVDATRAAQLAASDLSAPASPPGDFRSLRLAGALALQERRQEAAAALLDRALMRAPLGAETMRLRAALARGEGDTARQFRLLRLAASVSWRDPPTQRRLLLRAFGADDLADGVVRADALLRLAPKDPTGLAALMTAADYDDGRAALARHLAVAPTWRKPLLDGFVVGGEEDAQALVKLLALLRTSAAPPTTEENGNAVAKLIQAGQGPLALAYWQAVSGRPAGYDWLNNDPDFAESLPFLQAGEPGPPFGWSLGDRAGVQVGGGRDAGGRPALAFDAAPDGSDRVVSRYVLLAPGRYTLSFSGASDGQPTSRFRPRFTCAADGRSLSFATNRPTPAGGYLRASVSVQVPADCSALLLSFGLSPGDDGQMHGFTLRQVHWSRGGA